MYDKYEVDLTGYEDYDIAEEGSGEHRNRNLKTALKHKMENSILERITKNVADKLNDEGGIKKIRADIVYYLSGDIRYDKDQLDARAEMIKGIVKAAKKKGVNLFEPFNPSAGPLFNKWREPITSKTIAPQVKMLRNNFSVERYNTCLKMFSMATTNTHKIIQNETEKIRNSRYYRNNRDAQDIISDNATYIPKERKALVEKELNKIKEASEKRDEKVQEIKKEIDEASGSKPEKKVENPQTQQQQASQPNKSEVSKKSPDTKKPESQQSKLNQPENKKNTELANPVRFQKIRAKVTQFCNWVVDKANKMVQKLPEGKLKKFALKILRGAKNLLSKSKALTNENMDLAKKILTDAQELDKQLNNMVSAECFCEYYGSLLIPAY